MRHRWRGLLAFGVGLCLVAASSARAKQLGEAERQTLREALEVLHVAHERYGAEVPYRHLVYAAIDSMLRGLDPHTNFLTPAAYDNMRRRQQGSFYGLGILVSMRNGRLTVIAPIEGTPGSRLGLRSGDVIDTVDGEPTGAMSLDEAVGKLKGPRGTEVRVTIVRPGLEEPFELTITREEIPQTTVRYAYMMTPEVGYIRLTDFSRSTSREMRESLTRLRREGMTRLLFDLRSNGGGLLDQAVAVADEFLPAGSEIVSTRGRIRDSHQEFLDSDGDPDPELALPLVVLVNRGTASAAEIVAGSIQDHDVGLLVGTPTWGKGLVQTTYNLSYGAGIAVTTSRYHTPSGRLIQRDYSSYYDYYTDDRDPDVAESPAGPEFFSDLGRTLYGGGGITPDVHVEIPDGPLELQTLFATNAFFDFAVDYRQRHPSLTEAWAPGPEILAEFAAWLGDRGFAPETIETTLAEEDAREFTRRQIHSDIFTAAFGPEAAHRVLAAGDVQIQRALELFDAAGELLGRRRDLASAPPRQVAASEEPDRRRPPSGLAPPAPQTRYWPAALKAIDRFVDAKLLAEYGAFEEAARAFEESIRLHDSDPYTRIGHAEFRFRLAQLSKNEETRLRHFEAAAAEAVAARDLAPRDPDILRTLAQIHLRLGEHERAAIDLAREAYETLREMTEGDLQVLTSLGQIYLWAQEPERAVEVLREAQSHQPRHRMIERMLADALAAAGDFDGAAETLTGLLGHHPDAEQARLDLARIYSERGDHGRATEVLREAPSPVATRPQVRRALARELHLAGADDEALELVDELLAENADQGLRRLRVAILSHQLRYPEAIEELESLLAAETDREKLVENNLLIARLLERVGRAEEAAEKLRGLADGSTGRAALQARLGLVGVLERDGRIDEAVAVLERQMEAAAGDDAHRLGRNLIQVLLDSGRFDQALALADRLAERAQDGPAAAQAIATRLGVLDRAERWDRITELAPQLFEAADPGLRELAATYHARALVELGRIDEALGRLEASGRELGSRRLLVRRVEILLDHGRDGEADSLLAEVVASGEPEDLRFAAGAYQRGERYEKAIPLLQQALEEEPTSVDTLFLLGMTSERAGRYERAAEVFRRLLELAPAHAPTLNYLGYMWAERGENLEEALALVRRAVAQEPDNGAYVDSLGLLYLQLGRHDEARRSLEWAVRLLPTDPTTHEHLGDVYVAQQELVRARESYRRALDLGDADQAEVVGGKLRALED